MNIATVLAHTSSHALKKKLPNKETTMPDQNSSNIKTVIVGLCAILILVVVVRFLKWRYNIVHRELSGQIKGKSVLFPPKKLYLAEAKGKGMGVFASDAITKGEVVEVCHIYFLKRDMGENLPTYTYAFPKGETKKLFLVFGFGSIYNHCDENNIDWECDGKTMKFFATRNINVNEECCIRYRPIEQGGFRPVM